MKQLLGCSNSGRESQELEKVPGVAVQHKGRGGSGTNRALLLSPAPAIHTARGWGFLSPGVLEH